MEQTVRKKREEAEEMEQRPKSEQGFEAAYDAYGPMVYRLAMVSTWAAMPTRRT